jgi:RNA polymerase sigma-70 factor (ECF subfamily)
MAAAQEAMFQAATWPQGASWIAEWSSIAPSLRRVARRLTRDDDEAEDLLQETAVRAHRFSDSFRQGTSLRAWLHRILRNTFASHYRKRRREREVVERAHIEGALAQARTPATEEPRAVAASLSDEVMRALESLPAEYRAVLTLVVVDGLSYRETADALGCPIGTVMSRLHRARAAMLAALTAEPAIEPQARRRKARGSVPHPTSSARTGSRKAETFGGFVTQRAA